MGVRGLGTCAVASEARTNITEGIKIPLVVLIVVVPGKVFGRDIVDGFGVYFH